MAWSLVVGQVASATIASGTTQSVTLPAAVTAGNFVCAAFMFFNGGGGGAASMTCMDNMGNVFTVTPNSPSTYDANAGQIWHAYYAVKNNSRLGQTITATWPSAITTAAGWVAEFTGGWGVLDGDNKGTGTGTAINTPTITVTGTAELLYTGAAYSNGITSVDAPFTAVATARVGCWAGYDLSASANTAIAMTGNSGVATWSSLGMSFNLAPYISAQPETQVVYAGQTATYNITATTSGGTLHYQWKDDGGNVGTDSNSYTTGATVIGDNGSIITCDVSDDNGTFTSDNAYLYVLPSSSVAWIMG
jgi:hypothetical protein